MSQKRMKLDKVKANEMKFVIIIFSTFSLSAFTEMSRHASVWFEISSKTMQCGLECKNNEKMDIWGEVWCSCSITLYSLCLINFWNSGASYTKIGSLSIFFPTRVAFSAKICSIHLDHLHLLSPKLCPYVLKLRSLLRHSFSCLGYASSTTSTSSIHLRHPSTFIFPLHNSIIFITKRTQYFNC